jgi:CubicO group peptidase (beta-lactamase class C family)
MQSRRATTFHLIVSLCTALVIACAPTRPLAGAKESMDQPCPTRPYWPTAAWRPLTPAVSHLDTTELQRADRFVAESMPNLYSLMVIQHGYVVAERYWHGADSSTTFDLRSATKSFTSTVVGEELADHALKGLDQRLSDFFPD